jgi:hypothetical protein
MPEPSPTGGEGSHDSGVAGGAPHDTDSVNETRAVGGVADEVNDGHGAEAEADVDASFGSPFGKAMIEMVNHQVLAEIAETQEAM